MERPNRHACRSRDRWSKEKGKQREKEGKEMTLCLDECLRAVGLQHHYARFTSMGVCLAAHLAALTMEDYPLLGIRTMEERTRLFHLVQMIKTLDLESLEYEDDYDDYGAEGGDEGSDVEDSFNYDGYGDPVRRRLDFESTDQHQKKPSYAVKCGCNENNSHRTDAQCHPSNQRTRRGATGGIQVQDLHTTSSPKCVPFHTQKYRPAPVKTFNRQPVGHSERRRIFKKEKLPTEIHSHGASASLAKKTPIYESKRSTGYNYGLPLSSPPAPNKTHEGERRISVCVRKRPLTRAQSRRGEADVVTTSGGECVVVHESKEAVDLTQYILQHRFYFDQVFGEESSNEEVYQRTAHPLVQHMLSGGKATCFAYGQTGAGKTHTMLGSSAGGPGLYALAVRDIFASLSTSRMLSPLLVYVSFFEIYCGQLYDLLDHRKRLFAREDGQKVVHIAGLRDVRVDSVSALLQVISQGMEERTQGMSGVNPLSSRSHALLQIQLRCPNQQIRGRMWFVDLAGSERASDTKDPDKQSRMEGAEINQSLLVLKECIRSLDQEQSHTPFRQSKLTQVLKDSFVGDSMTCMIANISPGQLATEHTLNTLRYADRVKELRGQGQRRRSKTMPSPKHNLSNSSSGSSAGPRGKSPPKKQKLGRQPEAFAPTSPHTRSPTEDANLCSTPKDSRGRAQTSAMGRGGIGLEHVTPIRGWLGPGDRRPEANERNRHSGGDHNTRTGPDKQRERDLHTSDEKDKEKQRHLRMYHQQLQRFTASPPSSSVSLLSPSTFPSSLHSSICPLSSPSLLSASALTHQDEGDVSRAGVGIRADANRGLWPSPSGEIRCNNNHANTDSGGVGDHCTASRGGTEGRLEQGESDERRSPERTREARLKREDERPAGMGERERRWAWLAAENRVTGATPTVAEAQVSYSCRSDDSRQRGGEGLQSTKDPAERSNDWEGGSPHQRAPAERPLSPASEHVHTHRSPNKQSGRSFESKHTSCISSISPPPLRNDPSSYSLSPKQQLSASITPDTDSLSYTMDPLSLSMLQVEPQAATSSFLQGEQSNPSPRQLENERGGNRSGGKRDQASDNFVEAEDTDIDLSFLELPKAKTYWPITSDLSRTDLGGKDTAGIGRTKPALPQVTLVRLQVQENNQKLQTVPVLCTKATCTPAQAPLVQSISPSHSRLPNVATKHTHSVHSKPPGSSISTPQSEGVPDQGDIIHSTHSCSAIERSQESASNELSRPSVHHPSTLNDLNHALCRVVQAHWEQLEEMEALCHREGTLLFQQPDMAFGEYVHKLEEIMEKKALCVHSMRAQLQPYLMLSQSKQTQ